MKTVDFPEVECVNYLTPTNDQKQSEEPRADWQHRMQNLSISCALVCLIILGSSALVGAFGVLKHQISAVLVTGVMYLLAATFALFTLAIIHFKRRSGREDDCGPRGSSDGVILGPGGEGYTSLWRPYLAARAFTPAWSLDLGWAALGVCAAASTLWILLAKVMRYTPISTMLA
ncbi:uncharacterized protein [Halyomorpha halys]|uniref:uncharacterized protein n=1 Tax=Halyomorpha halys TaxID=286706 RepID=UPI0006D4E891|nr:uncharacterized protein LOC106684150 [Halyomorpha halys]